MKKFAAFITVLALIAALLTTASAEIIGMSQAQGISLTLAVNYEENVLMAKYDVDVFVDEELAGTIYQGQSFELAVDGLEEGEHRVMFCKSGAHSINGYVDLQINADSVLKCGLKAHERYIEIQNPQMLRAEDYAFSPDESVLAYTINYESNIVMAKYDIEVYVDGELVATVSNGKSVAGEIAVEPGVHTVTFCKAGDKSVTGSTTVTVNGYTVFKHSLKSHRDYIEVK